MDNQKKKLSDVIKVLEEKGYSEDQIADFVAQLTKIGFTQLYTQAMSVFSDGDMAAVEACKDQEEANELIKKLYAQRTGKDAQTTMQQFIDTFAEGFIAEYEKQSQNPPQQQ